MKLRFLPVLLVGALLMGCTDRSHTILESPTSVVTNVARTSDVQYVCIGMEYSQRFGACPGCQYDSDRMATLFRETFGYPGKLLQTEQATRANVVQALREGIALVPENGLFILYYSGHGGREKLPSSWNTEEPEDGGDTDEYLCLYDTYLLDDDIWDLISTCRGRVFCCFDACHSQTLFRSITGDVALERGLGIALEDIPLVKSRGFTLAPRGIPLESGGLRMLCWSGCLEAEYSYGSSRGGVLTSSILKNWAPAISYAALFGLASADVQREQPTQHPHMTQYGSGFEEAFR